MQEQKKATLQTIFSEVLADLAFMFTDDEPVETSPDETWFETDIGYEGSTSGTLRLRCTRAFSILLSANLLGTSPDDDDAESNAKDAVKEFMNIICGQYITAMHGTQDVFNLTIPETRELEEPPDFHDEGGESAMLYVDGHQVQLVYCQGKTVAVTE